MIEVKPFDLPVFVVKYGELLKFSCLKELLKAEKRLPSYEREHCYRNAFYESGEPVFPRKKAVKAPIIKGEPVWGVRKSRGGPYGYHRKRMKTYQLKRQAVFFAEDGETGPRLKLSNIPDSWDDQGRTLQRSWKAFRKCQWK